MLSIKNQYAILFLLILLFNKSLAQQTSNTDIKTVDRKIKNISGENWTFYSKKTCGFIDRNIYISNGTFQQVLFFSNEPFSLVVQQDSQTSLFTGFSFSKQINNIIQTQIRKESKVYEITRRNVKKQQNQTQKQTSVSNQKRYYAKLSIYGMCKTISFSTHFKEIQVQITFNPNKQDKRVNNYYTKENLNINPQQQQSQSINRVRVKIGATVYCMNGRSIKQANFFVNKLYEVLIISFIGLAISFRFLRKIPWWMRVISLIGTFYAVYGINTWYEALLSSYFMVLLVVIFYRMFESFSFMSYSRQYLFSKSFIIISLASAVPLAIKSHLDNDKIEHKKILLHIVNIVILCNILLFTQSLIHIQRFRHAFYYFIVLMLAEVFFKQFFQNSLVFDLLQIQVFPAPPQSQSLFFTIMFIPLCDFFFKSYSSDHLLKFFILLLPVISYPYQLKSSTSFAVGFILWLLKQAIKGRDLTKIIKHKR